MFNVASVNGTLFCMELIADVFVAMSYLKTLNGTF